ncbi:MAG: SBBP repeat-containing protein, partial [Anaerolineae bacterium]
VNDMVLDSAGNLFLTGATYSMDFPSTEGVLNEIHRGGEAAFVAKVSSDGANLDYATFLTGGGDNGRSVAVDGEGNAYVAGTTFTEEFPVTPKAFDTTFDFEDIFVAKLNPTGSALKYATFLGGSSSEFGDVALAVDAEGFAYVTGSTNSSDFPITSGAYDADYNGGTSQGDAFIVRLNRSGTALSYASYLGGSLDDRGKGVVVDAAGYGYVIGDTESEDFPTTTGSFAPTTGDAATGLNAFVTKLAMPPSYAIVGQVEGTDGEPLVGVVVSDDAGRSATTDQHGYFVLSDLAPGTYTLDVQPGADYRPPEEKPVVQVPPDNDDVNIQLPLKPVSIILEPSTSSNLEYTTSGGEGLTLEFPANAVDTTTTLFLTPTVAHHGQGLVWAGCAFDLSAEQEGTAQASFQFNQPVAVTIAYQDSELGTFNDETGLMLMQWTADGWQDVLDVCSSGGEYLRSSSENKVSVPICSTGRFALMSEVRQVYLPLLTKE